MKLMKILGPPRDLKGKYLRRARVGREGVPIKTSREITLLVFHFPNSNPISSAGLIRALSPGTDTKDRQKEEAAVSEVKALPFTPRGHFGILPFFAETYSDPIFNGE